MLEVQDRNLERWYFRFYDRPRFEKDFDRFQIADSLARILEQNQNEMRENVGAKYAKEKIALASSVMFDLTIAGYSSLNLDMVVGSLDKLSEVFDNDFDSFCVFLNVFCPMAYAEVFSQDDADRIDFSVKVPDSYREEFQTSKNEIVSRVAASSNLDASGTKKSEYARNKAEWLWRIANGSLLVPVFIALFVMYECIVVLKGIESMQYSAMKPVLDLQLNLLEEDRARLFKDATIPTVPSANTVAKP